MSSTNTSSNMNNDQDRDYNCSSSPKYRELTVKGNNIGLYSHIGIRKLGHNNYIHLDQGYIVGEDPPGLQPCDCCKFSEDSVVYNSIEEEEVSSPNLANNQEYNNQINEPENEPCSEEYEQQYQSEEDENQLSMGDGNEQNCTEQEYNIEEDIDSQDGGQLNCSSDEEYQEYWNSD